MNTENLKEDILLKPNRQVGIIGYGAYIPQYRLPAAEIARVWGKAEDGLPIIEKSVPGLDEDTVTMSIEASRNALKRADIDLGKLRAVWVGSESHPYAVKPSATIVAEAIGASAHIQAADMEFACKAGTEAFVMAMGLVGSGMAEYALAVGADTAQGKPGDALEYTAAAGAAAFILGPADQHACARVNATYSFVTDTPDFWRRAHMHYPEHGQRFTGEPAYFRHVATAAQTMMDASGMKASDYAYAVFHQPNAKFPRRVAKKLGFTEEQINIGLLAPVIGNTYAAASPLGLTAVLDIARPGDRVLVVSYGSGAGSDALDIEILNGVKTKQGSALKTAEYISRRKEIDYALYARYRGILLQK